MAEFLYSELNKNVVSVDFDGVNTTTANTTVNNETRKISVDVKCVPQSLIVHDGAVTTTFDGSAQKEITLNSYNIKRLSTTEHAKEYALFKGNTQVVEGTTIVIPFDRSIKSIVLAKCTQADVPQVGFQVGDFYLDITCTRNDESGLEEKLYCNLRTLQTQITADIAQALTQAKAYTDTKVGDEANTRSSEITRVEGLVSTESQRAQGQEALRLNKPVNPQNGKIYIPCYTNGQFSWIALDDIVTL